MADLSITATAVKTEDPVTPGIAGEAITAGQPLYKDDDEWFIADANVVGKDQIDGIAMNSVAAGQWLCILGNGADLIINAVATVATEYCLSATAGGIAPYGDLTSGSRRVEVGYGKSTTVITTNFVDKGIIP